MSSSILGLPSGSAGKESTCNAGDLGFDPWVGKIHWRREWLPTSVFWSGEFLDCIVHGVAKSRDTTEQLSLSLDIRNSLFATLLILGVGKLKKQRNKQNSLHRDYKKFILEGSDQQANIDDRFIFPIIWFQYRIQHSPDCMRPAMNVILAAFLGSRLGSLTQAVLW